MKKMILSLSLTVAALGLLMAPAMAATSAPQVAPMLSAADQAFLSSLAAPVGTPAPVDAAKRPAIGKKGLCSATANCWDGGTVTCNGNNSTTSCTAVDGACGAEPGHVTCDGVTTSCPNPCPPPICDCAALRDDCALNCDPCAFSFTCNATTCATTCQCRFRLCRFQ